MSEFKPVTNERQVPRIYRIVDAVEGAPELFNLLDPSGVCVRTDNNTQALADYALESGIADQVRHDEDLIRAHSAKHFPRCDK